MITDHGAQPVPVAPLLTLFETTTWARGRAAADVSRMLDGSLIALGAWEGDALVGFARATGDGVYRALIDDVVVAPSGRGAGIGTALVRELLTRLSHVELVVLFCADEMVPWYEGFGLQRNPSAAMGRKRTEA